MKKEAAFTGLEAAIVLIAFVVVAAVFSYVMLGAGFFATQKSQEVTYSGVKQATSNVVLDGQLYGTYSAGTGLTELTFYIRVPEGGESVQLADIDYLYTKVDGDPASKTYGSTSLHAGQTTKIVLSSLGGPSAGSRFTLEIKPSVGASTLVQRTLASGWTGGVII
ncbi:flagellin [Methanospirillum sp. J.3.6.1-F.2.7.3]|uniref:Flagellin n=1 Tax=Methanospirillum purgamenti TaxID=2834276 RepID=A0A8E7EK63_9EURY|nr:MULTISPECIES: flagellin [Methanospirillum]MDX8551862.1 flagellin [Methanospirillum hungatei]QVV89175.1 flagellin [Methanospirillum sp. J.3.6.1-F.2.7.3]